MVFDQIQCYFTVNKLTTEFQHACRKGHSTSTALSQMTDDWLREIEDKMILWSGATKKDLGKLQLAQNMAAWLALGCTQRANINNMHVNLSWLKVEERLTFSLCFIYERH